MTDQTSGGVFLLNSDAVMSENHMLDYWSFLGRVVGVAVRHGMQLGLALPRTFWKTVVGLSLVPTDVTWFDKSADVNEDVNAIGLKLISSEVQLNALLMGMLCWVELFYCVV